MIDTELAECQRSLHEWGQANQAAFDATKESFHTLHRRNPVGGNFRFLGVTFDPRLVMDHACSEIAGQAHSRLRSLLRCRKFFSVAALVRHYKAQVLSFIEYATPAVHHAPSFFLGQIDKVQQKFLEEVGLSAEQALMNFNLAPLATRRDMAMLGLLFLIASGRAPPQFGEMIHKAGATPFPRNLRRPDAQHGRQLHDPVDDTSPKMIGRSVLGLIYSFNMLPESLVTMENVSCFQRRLQNGVKNAFRGGVDEWSSVLRTGVRKLTLTHFQNLFA